MLGALVGASWGNGRGVTEQEARMGQVVEEGQPCWGVQGSLMYGCRRNNQFDQRRAS